MDQEVPQMKSIRFAALQRGNYDGQGGNGSIGISTLLRSVTETRHSAANNTSNGLEIRNASDAIRDEVGNGDGDAGISSLDRDDNSGKVM